MPTPVETELVRAVAQWWAGWLGHRAAQLGVPGVQAAIRLDGQLLAAVAHGSADLGSEQTPPVALTDAHLFRIASHSKTFTATAVLQLVESGALRLDDEVGRWLPEVASTAPQVGRRTLRQLLSHGGGIIRDGVDGDFWVLGRSFPELQSLLAIVADEAVVLPTDRDFKYSNIGFGLLGLVVAAASGQDYNGYVTEHVVDRLGLADTGPELDPDRARELATGYSARSLGTRVPVEHVDTRALSAATGFYATATDLTAYFSAHLPGDDRLLGEDSKRAMQRQEWAVDDGGYGLGLMLSRAGGRSLFGHGGGYPGHITRSLVDRDARIVLSVLTNAVDGPASELAEAFFTVLALARRHDEQPGTDEPADVPAAIDRTRFCGRFASLWGVSDVCALGDRLFLLHPDNADPADDARPLSVVDATTLRFAERSGYGSPGELVRYVFADDGSVASVRLSSGVTHVPLDRWRPGARIPVPSPGTPTAP